MQVDSSQWLFTMAVREGSRLDEFKADLIDRTNARRREAGLMPVNPHPILMKTAQLKADKLSRLQIVQHVMPGGEMPGDLVELHGYPIKPGRLFEILCAGYEGPAEIIQAFRTSPKGHDKGLTSDTYHVGVGLAENADRVYVCMMFASPRRY